MAKRASRTTRKPEPPVARSWTALAGFAVCLSAVVYACCRTLPMYSGLEPATPVSRPLKASEPTLTKRLTAPIASLAAETEGLKTGSHVRIYRIENGIHRYLAPGTVVGFDTRSAAGAKAAAETAAIIVLDRAIVIAPGAQIMAQFQTGERRIYALMFSRFE